MELGLPKSTLGKLVKCMYGTRDAGAIWEQCYVDCLIDLGFKQGIASPCCFHHDEWDVAVVVHGDDFTALGTDDSLNLYEAGLKKAFECKVRGRLGLDESDMKEIRILNRIVRITDKGLLYEADPRHVELLAKSLGLETCKPVATPGVKQTFDETTMDLPVNDQPEKLSPVIHVRNDRRIMFDDKEPTTHKITAYSEIYGMHPSKFVFGKDGSFIKIRQDIDDFTGISKRELDTRKQELL